MTTTSTFAVYKTVRTPLKIARYNLGTPKRSEVYNMTKGYFEKGPVNYNP